MMDSRKVFVLTAAAILFYGSSGESVGNLLGLSAGIE